MIIRDKRLSPSYLAGIFDGEGSVGCKIDSKQRDGRTHSSFNIMCYITNTDLNLLDTIVSQYGGHVRKMVTLPGRKQLYRAEWWGAKADTLLRTIDATNELVVKDKRVKLALQFRNLKPNNGKGNGCVHYDSSLVNQLQRIEQEIKFLNRRGELAVAETNPEAPVSLVN